MRVLKTLVVVVVAERIDRKVVEPFSGVLGEFSLPLPFPFISRMIYFVCVSESLAKKVVWGGRV